MNVGAIPLPQSFLSDLVWFVLEELALVQNKVQVLCLADEGLETTNPIINLMLLIDTLNVVSTTLLRQSQSAV